MVDYIAYCMQQQLMKEISDVVDERHNVIKAVSMIYAMSEERVANMFAAEIVRMKEQPYVGSNLNSCLWMSERWGESLFPVVYDRQTRFAAQKVDKKLDALVNNR